jgi:hypothetical protein
MCWWGSTGIAASPAGLIMHVLIREREGEREAGK